MCRLLALTAVLLLVLGCEDQTGPAFDLSPQRPSNAVMDVEINQYAHWLGPIRSGVDESSFGIFDPDIGSLVFHVKCVAENGGPGVDGAGHDCSNLESHWSSRANAILTYAIGSGLTIQPDHYHAQVQLSELTQSDATNEYTYRLVATVVPYTGAETVVVAYADFLALANGKVKTSLITDEIATTANHLPAKLRLDEGAVGIAAAQQTGLIGVIEDDFEGGDYKITVVEPDEPVLATYEGGDGTTSAAFRFDGDESDFPFALAIGKTADCGTAFQFQQSGCHRAVAYDLVPPEPIIEAAVVTSGYQFEQDVEFCIRTDISPEDEELPWQLIKIDDYGEGAEFEILPQIDGGPCNFIEEPAPTTTIGWLRETVGEPILDFLVSPLYAGHSTDRMGSTLKDLSDLTAAVVPGLSDEIFDPAGDATPDGAPDLGSARVDALQGYLVLEVQFHSGFSSQTTRVRWQLDTDENPATGHPGVNAANDDSELMGTDYELIINGSTYGAGAIELLVWDANGGLASATTTDLTRSVHTDGYQIVIPLSQLGSDDGYMSFKANTQTELSATTRSGIHDYVTDLGSAPGSTRPPPVVE